LDKDFARQLIEHPGDQTTKQLFESAVGVFWVDWREADNYIVTLAADCIGCSELTAEWVGDKLHIVFRGKVTAVSLKPEPGQQDITLRALNKSLYPEFEIRYVKASDGGDTLAFMPLEPSAWSELESLYGAKVDAAFGKLASGSPLLFGGA
jgi:hypothetical protein